MNMKRAVAKGYAISLDFQNITEENFSEALNDLLSNPKYFNNAKRISDIYKDRPVSAKQSVVYWTEHAIRHQGADHLKIAGQQLNFFEFHLIDVYAVLVAGALLLLIITFKTLKLICKRKNRQVVKDKTN